MAKMTQRPISVPAPPLAQHRQGSPEIQCLRDRINGLEERLGEFEQWLENFRQDIEQLVTTFRFGKDGFPT